MQLHISWKKPENCSRCSYHTGFRSLRTMNCTKAAAICSVVSFGFWNVLSETFMSLPNMPNNLHAKRVFVHLPFGHNHLSKAQKVNSDVKISKCLQQYLKSSYTSIERFVQTLNANIFNMRLELAKLYLPPEPSCQNIANASCLLRVYFCLMDKSIKHKF